MLFPDTGQITDSMIRANPERASECLSQNGIQSAGVIGASGIQGTGLVTGLAGAFIPISENYQSI